jgi:uncharacterized protein YndB with AHSA1/START domain
MSMTINAGAVVDASEFSVRRTIRIAAPITKVWSAVSEAEHVSRWFGQLELDGTGVGAAGTISFTDYPSVPIRIEAVDAPRSIAYRWGNDDASGVRAATADGSSSTVFTFTLSEVEDGTELTVVETGFEATSDPAANLESHREGWTDELDKLVALLENEVR